MKFDSWMRKTGLSESSVRKYFGAIQGVLSDWASEAALIDGNILDNTSKTKFDAVAIEIRKLSIYKERNSTGHSMYNSALNKYSEYLAEGAIATFEEDIEEIIGNTSIALTEKAKLVSSRVGQGQFRSELLLYWGKCAVTGYKDPAMLVASHIKPWSRSTNFERLDKFNGLLLTPTLDRAFDQGHISFSESGEILISNSFQEPKVLGIKEKMFVQLTAEHQKYMVFHREEVFKCT